LPDESFVTTFGDKIFQTNLVNNSVTCYTISGEKLWEFRDESVLRNPVSIAVDNNCEVYKAVIIYIICHKTIHFPTDCIWCKEYLYSLNSSLFYVTSCYYNKVIVLSPDGKQWRQLLDQNDRMNGPYGISIDKPTNNILITNVLGPTLMVTLLFTRFV
jgi:hypothetical protein